MGARWRATNLLKGLSLRISGLPEAGLLGRRSRLHLLAHGAAKYAVANATNNGGFNILTHPDTWAHPPTWDVCLSHFDMSEPQSPNSPNGPRLYRTINDYAHAYAALFEAAGRGRRDLVLRLMDRDVTIHGRWDPPLPPSPTNGPVHLLNTWLEESSDSNGLLMPGGDDVTFDMWKKPAAPLSGGIIPRPIPPSQDHRHPTNQSETRQQCYSSDSG